MAAARTTVRHCYLRTSGCVSRCAQPRPGVSCAQPSAASLACSSAQSMSKKLRRALSTTCNILRQMADQALETGCTQDLRAMHRSYRRLQKVNAAVPRLRDQYTTNAPHNKPHYPRHREGERAQQSSVTCESIKTEACTSKQTRMSR